MSMTHTDDALTEAVAEAMYEVMPRQWSYTSDMTGTVAGMDILWDELHPREQERYSEQARVAIATIRAHDEQAALNCGHCSEPDEIACACQIKERDDEQ